MEASLSLEPSLTQQIRVRRATAADWPAIQAMLIRVYPERWELKVSGRWLWLYRDNPMLTDIDPPLWVAEDPATGMLFGQSGTMIEPAIIAGRQGMIGWSVDTILSKELRGRGIGRRLQEMNQQANPVFAAINPSPVNQTIKRKIGGRHIATACKEYLRPVSPNLGPMIRRRLRLRSVAVYPSSLERAAWSSLNRLAAASMRLHLACTSALAMRASSASKRVRLQPIDVFDDHFAILWQRCRDRYVCAVERTPTYLTWKYGSQPGRIYRTCAAFVDGDMVAYTIYRVTLDSRTGRTSMTIADQIHAGGQAGALRAILVRLLTFATKAGMEFVRIATSDPEQVRLLNWLGFVAIRQRYPIVGVPGDHKLAEQLVHGNWMLSRGDHDCDQPQPEELEDIETIHELDTYLRAYR